MKFAGEKKLNGPESGGGFILLGSGSGEGRAFRALSLFANRMEVRCSKGSCLPSVVGEGGVSEDRGEDPDVPHGLSFQAAFGCKMQNTLHGPIDR